MAFIALQQLQQLFLVFAISVALARASYYMDDTDGRISYTGEQYGPYHAPLWNIPMDESNEQFIDVNKLYGGSW
jgi:hypothetical protein